MMARPKKNLLYSFISENRIEYAVGFIVCLSCFGLGLCQRKRMCKLNGTVVYTWGLIFRTWSSSYNRICKSHLNNLKLEVNKQASKQAFVL